MKLITWLLPALVCCPAAALADETPATPPRPPELKQALDVAITATISVELLKRTFQDPRPEDSGLSGYAFPSGHATAAFALAAVASEYQPEQKWLWYLVAAGVAWSRVECNAHDWDDVIAGAALGNWLGNTTVAHGGLVLKEWEW